MDFVKCERVKNVPQLIFMLNRRKGGWQAGGKGKYCVWWYDAAMIILRQGLGKRNAVKHQRKYPFV